MPARPEFWTSVRSFVTMLSERAARESETSHAEPLGALDGAAELDSRSLTVTAVVALQQRAGEPVPRSGGEGRSTRRLPRARGRPRARRPLRHRGRAWRASCPGSGRRLRRTRSPLRPRPVRPHTARARRRGCRRARWPPARRRSRRSQRVRAANSSLGPSHSSR